MIAGLEEQIKRIVSISNKTSVAVPQVSKQESVYISNVQEELLEAYALDLENKERELVEALRRATLEYGAQISVIRDLLRQMGRDIEKRVVWKEKLLEENETDREAIL